MVMQYFVMVMQVGAFACSATKAHCLSCRCFIASGRLLAVVSANWSVMNRAILGVGFAVVLAPFECWVDCVFLSGFCVLKKRYFYIICCGVVRKDSPPLSF